MSAALKPIDTDCYFSSRVYDGIRVKDSSASEKHNARLKRILSKPPYKVEAVEPATEKDVEHS